MASVRSRAWVPAPIDEVFAFFDDPANLGRLMPPPVSIRLGSVEPAPPRPGSVFTFSYGIGGLRRTWVVRLLERDAPRRFVDETLSGPLARFHHTHSFSAARRGTWISDQIEYRVGPGGGIGAALDWLAGWVMRATFVWRAARQRRLLGSPSRRAKTARVFSPRREVRRRSAPSLPPACARPCPHPAPAGDPVR